jgi:hypothetical protein
MEKTSRVAEIAEKWGTSRAYVYKLAKKGCPIDSVEAASAWRSENSKLGVGYRTKNAPEMASSSDEEGDSPQDDRTAADYSVPSRRPRVKTIEQSLKEAILVEEMAALAVRRAANEPEKMVTAINAYNKAQSNRMEAEKRVVQIDVERKKLIPIDVVREMIRRAWAPMLARLRSAPKRAAIKANPNDDVLAEAVFREEIEEAIAEGEASYAEAVG